MSHFFSQQAAAPSFKAPTGLIPSLNRVITTLLVLAPVRLYQFLTAWLPHTCRFTPSCSQYMMDAVSSIGLAGIFCGLGRLLRCHPLHVGGYDPFISATSSTRSKPLKMS